MERATQKIGSDDCVAPEDTPPQGVPPYRRAAERLPLNLFVRCVFADGSERPGLIIDISATGIALRCAKQIPVGEPVVMKVDYLGRFMGTVVRHVHSGFAAELRLTPDAREKLRQRLGQLADPQSVEASIWLSGRAAARD